MRNDDKNVPPYHFIDKKYILYKYALKYRRRCILKHEGMIILIVFMTIAGLWHYALSDFRAQNLLMPIAGMPGPIYRYTRF